ncbi:hypothetical protein VP01_142g9 [Puccinia sorghi]|uniref:Uncharacterized protein n=1 Tax=Puccinia sorghi TaxID=27349 RepID=A0A0L6VKL9_9BASI|nr:hypothetical protein VP01_142g9 [Puccinia sorghi]
MGKTRKFSRMKKALNKSMLPRYHLSSWKSYRDQQLKPTYYRLPDLKHLLQEKQVAITSIQEHLRKIKKYVPGIQGYKLFNRPKEKDFRVQCLCVQCPDKS